MGGPWCGRPQHGRNGLTRLAERLDDEGPGRLNLDLGGTVGEELPILRDRPGGVSLGEEHRSEIQMRHVRARGRLVAPPPPEPGPGKHRRVLSAHARLELEPSGLRQRLRLFGVLGEDLQIELERPDALPVDSSASAWARVRRTCAPRLRLTDPVAVWPGSRPRSGSPRS